MFDEEAYGRQLAADPKTLPEVYRAWAAATGQSSLPDFAAWVHRTTDIALTSMLDEGDARALAVAFSTRGEDGGPSIDSLMVLEGLDSGP